jgi:hypothetical protein
MTGLKTGRAGHDATIGLGGRVGSLARYRADMGRGVDDIEKPTNPYRRTDSDAAGLGVGRCHGPHNMRTRGATEPDLLSINVIALQ